MFKPCLISGQFVVAEFPVCARVSRISLHLQVPQAAAIQQEDEYVGLYPAIHC